MKLGAWIGKRTACMMLAVVMLIGSLPMGVQAVEAAASYSISTGSGPHAIAVNATTNRIYAVHLGSNRVTVIEDGLEPGSAAIAAEVQTGTTPYALAVNSLTDKIYVANVDSDNITVIDGATNGTVTIPAGTMPIAVAVNEMTNKIYVANVGSGDVTVIDGATNETVTIAAGTSPFDIAVDRVLNKIYVANADSDTVTVIDGASHSAMSVPAGAGPNALAVDSATGRVYVANFFSNDVTAIEGATGVATTISAGLTPNAVEVNEATGKIYVANDNGNSVTVIDRTDHSTSTVFVGRGPSALAVDLITNTIYTANYNSHDVTIINGADHTTATVSVGQNPIAIAVHAGIGKVYAGNFNGGTISVIDVDIDPPVESSEPEVSQPQPEFISERTDGLTVESGAAKWTSTTTDNGKTVLTARLNADVLTKAFGRLEAKAPGSRNVTFTVTGAGDIRQAGIPAHVLKAAAATVPNAVLTIRMDNTVYDLPVNLPALMAELEQLGGQLDDAIVYVSMETVASEDARRTEAIAIAKAAGAQVVGDLVEFSLTVQSKDRLLTVSDFGNTYVTRSMRLPGAIDPAAATAVSFDLNSGTVSFVPSVFAAADADNMAVRILRPGNSLYAVVEAQKSFADVRGHWAKADIELLASKLVVNGMTETSFVPENPVTRAEFASLLIRALGLREDPASETTFRDMEPADWFAGAVGTASRANIVSGFEDGTFRPDDRITREQMAVMTLRALRFTGQYRSELGMPNSVLAAFEDRENISSWAKASVEQIVYAGLMNGVADDRFEPDGHATRAEAAVIVKRLLQTAAFININ